MILGCAESFSCTPLAASLSKRSALNLTSWAIAAEAQMNITAAQRLRGRTFVILFQFLFDMGGSLIIPVIEDEV
jgi:hypothetical protein